VRRTVIVPSVAAGLAAVVVWSAASAHASSVTIGAKTLAANSAAVSSCDTDRVTIVPNLSGANVVSITMGSIDAACGGGTLSIAFSNGTTSSTGSGVIPGGGGALTVTLAAAVAAKDSAQVFTTIVGP